MSETVLDASCSQANLSLLRRRTALQRLQHPHKLTLNSLNCLVLDDRNAATNAGSAFRSQSQLSLQIRPLATGRRLQTELSHSSLTTRKTKVLTTCHSMARDSTAAMTPRAGSCRYQCTRGLYSERWLSSALAQSNRPLPARYGDSLVRAFSSD